MTHSCLLVTGAGGFLGSAVVRAAQRSDRDVIAMVRPGSSKDRLGGLDAEVVETELRDGVATAVMIEKLRPAVVVHAAAAPGHPTTATARTASWADNFMATVNLLEALASSPSTSLVHVGSGTEYAPSDSPLSEEHPGDPMTFRGVTKRAATMAVRQWAAQNSRRAVVVRPFSIYGPGEHNHRLISTLLRCAATGEPFTMLDGISRRDLVHVDDVAEGCVRASAVSSPEAPVINLGTGVEYSVPEVVAAVERSTRASITLSAERRQPQPWDVPHWVADTSRCHALLNWVPIITLDEGLERLVRSGAP
jgi:nucleoside-diphosphate-sugar epimerase